MRVCVYIYVCVYAGVCVCVWSYVLTHTLTVSERIEICFCVRVYEYMRV